MAPAKISPFTPSHRRVAPERGLAWITEGWQLFRQAPGPWLGIGAMLFLFYGVLSLVLFLGQMTAHLLTPVLTAGLLLGCRSLDNGGPLRTEHLFAGFRQNTGNLVLIGVFYLVGAVLILMIALFGGGGMAILGGLLGSSQGVGGMMAAGMFSGVAMMMLLFLLLYVPLLMALWFAPALVLFQDMAPLPAMLTSFSACLSNFLPFVLYSLLLLVMMTLAAIPLGLGFVLAIPLLACSAYISYLDIFE